MSAIGSDFTAPADEAVAVTKSDSLVYDIATRALFIGGAGDVAVAMAGDGAVITFKNVPAGSILPIRVKKVMSTNTSATDIVALR